MPRITNAVDAFTTGQSVDKSLFDAALRPVIIGPRANLIRYSEADEKADGLFTSAYDYNSDETFNVPNFVAGYVFDELYSKLSVTFEGVHLLYATKTVGSGTPDAVVEPVADFDNRITSDSNNLVFATNSASTHTMPFFGDRGVQVGDVVHLYATVSASLRELWATVTGFVAETVAASIAAAAADSGNAGTESAAATVTKDPTTPANQVVMTADAALWNSTVYPTDTYTIVVATAGAGGNGGARINVTSARGDNKLNVPVATFGSVTVATEKGLRLTFSLDTGAAVDPGVSSNTLVTTDGLGNFNPQKWTVAVTGAHTAPTATSGGTYTGTELDTQVIYTVECVKGGVYPKQLATPPSVAATVSIGAGSTDLANGDYYVAYTFVNSTGETTMGGESLQFTITDNATEVPTVTLPALPIGITSINLYLTEEGGASGSETLYMTGIQSTTVDLEDGPFAGGDDDPASNTCVVNKAIAAPIQIPVIDVTGGGATGGSLQAGAYYLKYAYANGTGHTTPSPESAQFTVSAGNKPRVWLPVLPVGVTSITIYLTAAGGGTGTQTSYKYGVVTTSAQPYYDLVDAQAVGDAVNTINYCQVDAEASAPRFNIIRSDGVDGASNVPFYRSGTTMSVGAKGVTVSFNQSQQVLGNRYTITVTTKQTGRYRTLKLNKGLSSVGLDAATDLNVEFYIKETSMVIPEDSVVAPFGPNWSLDLTGTPTITLYDGIQMFDSAGEWTVSDVAEALPVKKIDGAYLTYRQWVVGDVAVMDSLDDVDDVEDALGIVDPDNPIAQAVYFALLGTPSGQEIEPIVNASSDSVNYVVTNGDPTLTETWSEALEAVSGDGTSGVYNLVPLSTDTEVHALFAANVTSESSDANANYRAVFLPAAVSAYTPLVTEAINDDVVVTAILTQDPDVSSDSFTILTDEAGEALFVTRGVAVGDEVRFQFGTDVYGNETYETYEVAAVVSEDELQLVSGPDAAVSSAIKVEVHHPLSRDSQVNGLITAAEAYSNKRVKYVWPDLVDIGGENYPGYYLNAILAASSGSLSPHQGMTKLEVVGLTTDARRNYFNNTQLSTLSDGGVWVVRQQADSEGGKLYTQHAVTTATTPVADYEEMTVRLVDAVAYAYTLKFSELYGAVNNTAAVQDQVRSDFDSVTGQLLSLSVGSLGTLLLSSELISLVVDPNNPSRLIMTIRITFPYPLNQVELRIAV